MHVTPPPPEICLLVQNTCLWVLFVFKRLTACDITDVLSVLVMGWL